jgi:RHS repeat-associated protein
MTDPGPADRRDRQSTQPARPAPTGHTSGSAAGSAAGDATWRPAAGGPPAPPAVSLPKGGGAIRDIGEKFSVSQATGTASLTVPVQVSPGRSGSEPDLGLHYDSGSGNGPFGLGWHVPLASITRKTDKGLPHYDDRVDTFVHSGTEDLVPVREERDGAWVAEPHRRTADGREYEIHRYRPRIEGLFAVIELWRDLATGRTHWREISSDNVTTIYGATPASQVADPADPARVFSWLICESYDDTGNVTVYDYVAEDSAGVDTALASERNRDDRSRSAARYPKRIRYGNRAARGTGDPGGTGDSGWMFEVVFDYGDHAGPAPEPEPDRPWPCRPDPFSTYRPGFEVRTYRRCHRVLMFHHFPGEPGVGADCLVSSTDLTYLAVRGSGMTTVGSVTRTGYRRLPGGGYRTAALPPLEFGYSEPVIGAEPRDLGAGALRNLPAGVDGVDYQWADLDGAGLSGVLARQDGAWYYKANLGDGRFAPERTLATVPAGSGARTQRLLDLAGDGHLDLVDLDGPVPGYYRRNGPGSWRSLRPFPDLPGIAWDDPDLRMVDLDGDGLADVLITGDDVFTWYASLGYDGFGRPRRVPRPEPPRMVFADLEQSIYLADMSGDGLSDLVRVRNGEVCYWPSTGFGRFGAKVTMDGSPWLDEPDQFEQRRVRLADVDGSGAADLVYLHRDGARLYLNQSGNGYGEPHLLPHGFPRADTLAQVTVTDLLGRGTACLVWSSPLPSDSGRQLRYVDLMTAGKPYLLNRMVNNLGAEISIGYAASTTFYLADQAAGRPWATRLPFPVQVVERVTTRDHVNRNTFTARYAYHHGYFDGFEREFRGFGMVEHFDAEEITVLGGTDLPPVLTRTWMHTGVFPGEGRVTRLYEHEYYRQPGGGGPELPDTALPGTLRRPGRTPRPWRLSVTDAREACRALKGLPLREEIYALDGTPAQDRPYAVTEHNYTIELLQPSVPPRPDGPQNYHGVFLSHARETAAAHYERALYEVDGEPRADPRISHDLVLEIDDWGNPLLTASAGYGRRFADPRLPEPDRAEQHRSHLTCTYAEYTNPVQQPDAHRTPLPSEQRDYEITGLRPDEGGLFGFAALRDRLAAIQAELPFQDWDTAPRTPARRLISRTRIRYRRDDLSGPLPPGVIEPLALPYRSYRQVLTGSLLTSLYGDRISAAALHAAGYVREDQTWWLPSGRVFYSPADGDDELAYARAHFFVPVRFRDPFGHTTTVTHDRYDLLVSAVRDPLGNLVTAGARDERDQVTSDGNDYRVLAPRLVSDANRNRAAVAFDALGRVAGTAVMGKPEQDLGDSLDGFEPDPPAEEVAAFFADPDPRRLLGGATTRVLYHLDPVPAAVATLARETHASDLTPGERTKIQCSFWYSDGFGREVQHKGQGPDGEHPWIGSGWTVYNNKDKPVRSYEPFFTGDHGFEFARAAGVSAVLFYDPAGRTIATLHPDDSYAKVVFDPWRYETWDANDTVLLDPRTDPDISGYVSRYLATVDDWSTWYAQRIDGGLGPAAQRAAEQTVPHAATPSVDWLDSLDRGYLSVAHNRVAGEDQYCRTRTVLDIQGNQREVRDALGRAVMRQEYLMIPAQATRAGMDIGGGGLLPDVAGQPVRAWNSRGFEFRTEYDELRRPVRSFVSGPGIDGTAMQARTVYGESLPGAQEANLRTRVATQYDGAGVLTNEAYDFKGNLVRAARQIARDYRDVVDWSADVPLEDRAYPGSTSFDALNRPVALTTPDGSVMLPGYDPASMLVRLDGRLRGTGQRTTFVAHLEYNARGQRTLLRYGNGCSSRYEYDPATFRLTRLVTTRGETRLQDLGYAYDPAGNPTRVTDHAQQHVFFRNRVVAASSAYVYDALYRLIEASGREHVGQAGRVVPPGQDDAERVGLPMPGDGAAMTRYRERYAYDEVGNMLRIAHRTADPRHGGWHVAYSYHEPSLLEPERTGNRLTSAGRGRFGYDEQGNTTLIPGDMTLAWDHNDHLHSARDLFFGYDATARRVRKAGPRSERLYLGTFEVYREFDEAGAVTLERESLHVLDDVHRVALVETRTAGHDDGDQQLIRYQVGDHLDSSVVELDGDARVISYEEYYPYGCTSYQAVRHGPAVFRKRYRYTGRERDVETGLYYCGARYYAPWLARWTSCDPAGLADGVNLYGYVHGNPLRMSDPAGTAGAPPWLAAGRAFQAKVGGLLRSVGQKAHDIIPGSGYVKTPAGKTGYIDLAMENRAIETKLLDIGKGSYRTGGAVDLTKVADRARRWLTQVGKYREGIGEAGALDTSARRLEQTLVVGIKGAASSEEAGHVLKTVRGVLDTAKVKAGGLLVDASGELSTMSGKALGTAKSFVSQAASVATAVADEASAVKSASLVSKVSNAASRVARTLAPAATVLNRVAAPLAVLGAAAQVASAHTTAQKADAAVSSLSATATVVSTAATEVAAATVLPAAAPVAAAAGIAATSLVAGAYVGGKAADYAAGKGYGTATQVAAGTIAGAATGAAIGAVIGSVVPGVGTAAGAIIGGVAGAAGGFIKSYWR